MALGVAAGGLGSVLGPPRSLIRGKGLSMLVSLARRRSGGGLASHSSILALRQRRKRFFLVGEKLLLHPVVPFLGGPLDIL